MGKPLIVGTVALALIGGCSKRANPTGVQPDAGSLVVAKESATDANSNPAPSAPRKVVATRSFASFDKDVLDECVDVALVAPDGGVDEAKLTLGLDRFIKNEKKLVRLKASCDEQFPDRVVLASCFMKQDVTGDGGAPLTLALSSSHYSVRTLDDDIYMRDCLKSGGDWEAAKKDDPKVARERLKQRAKALQDIAGKAQ